MRHMRLGLCGWGMLGLAVLGLSAATPARAETVRVTVSYYSDATGPYFEKMAAAFHAACFTFELENMTIESVTP